MGACKLVAVSPSSPIGCVQLNIVGCTASWNWPGLQICPSICPSILTRTLHGAGRPVLAERSFTGSKTGTLGQVLLRAVQSQLPSLSVVGNRIVGSIVGSLHSTFEVMNLMKTLTMAQPSTVPAAASCRRHGPAVIARRASSQGCTTSQSRSTFSLSFANMSVLMRRRRTESVVPRRTTLTNEAVGLVSDLHPN